MNPSALRVLPPAGSRYTSTALLGCALIVLLFLFVLATLVTHGTNLAMFLSRMNETPLDTNSFIPGGLLHSGALFLLSAVAVILIRRRLLQQRSLPSLESSPPPSFSPPADTEVAHFLGRFLPGLTQLRLRMSPDNRTLVSRDTLFLPLGLLPPLASMASRSAGTSPVPEPPERLAQQAAYITLAHEEFHQLCFDAHTNATFRALCFVQFVALAPFFILLFTAPLPGPFTIAIFALTPVWFPFLIWVLIWGLHGGSHLLEHLADAHADQRIRPSETSRALEPQRFAPDLEPGAPAYIDSRSHHPRPNERLAFLRSLESKAVARIIFFQTLILFTLAAHEGIARELPHQWDLPLPLVAIRVACLITAALSALLFSAIVGTLAPLRQAVAATGLTSLFLLAHHFWASAQPLALNSPWLFLTLVPALGQWGGRVFLRKPLTRWLRTGTAPVDLPLRTERVAAADEAMLLALQHQPTAPPRPTRFRRLLELAGAHGQFFDAVPATGLSCLMAFTVAGFLPRMGFAGTVPILTVEALVLAIYFTRWPTRRSGILTLWAVRMAVLALGAWLGAHILNIYLYIESQGASMCPGNPAQQQICIGQTMMDLTRVEELHNKAINMVLERCKDAHLFPECLTHDSSPDLYFLRCAFYTPGSAIGPLFLACILISFFFDTGLSTLRWLAAWRQKQP